MKAEHITAKRRNANLKIALSYRVALMCVCVCAHIYICIYITCIHMYIYIYAYISHVYIYKYELIIDPLAARLPTRHDDPQLLLIYSIILSVLFVYLY